MLLFASVFFVIIAHLFAQIKIKHRGMYIANFETLRRVSKHHATSLYSLWMVLRIIALSALILAVAGIGVQTEGIIGGADYILLIDTSTSMLEDDIWPSRLAAVKDASKDFIDIIPANSRVAVISFSSTSSIEQSLTYDYIAVESAIDGISISKSYRTAIGEAIVTASDIANFDKSGNYIAILITDGQSNTGISLRDAVIHAKNNKVVINVIGIKGSGDIPVDVYSQLDEEPLKIVADFTSGKYFNVETKDDLNLVLTEMTDSGGSDVMYLGNYLIILVIIIILLEAVLMNTKYKTIP